MALATWTEAFSVGVPSIDREHQGLFEAMNTLHTDLRAGHSTASLAATLAALKDYSKIHLAGEEDLLRANGYPGLEQHAKMHEVFRARIGELDQQFTSGNTALCLSTLAFLSSWFSQHVMGVDMLYKPFLTEKGPR